MIEPNQLGEKLRLLGHYGKVYLRELIVNGEKLYVACKEIKPKYLDNYNDAYDEARLMTQLRHRHVVSLLGYTTVGPVPILITQYHKGGSLLEHLLSLRRKRSLDVAPLFRFAKEAASGMMYLHSNHVLHRDLAARNCLLEEDLTLRIADFGLSRCFDSYTEGYVEKENRSALPIYSTPIEVLIRGERFTIKGDAWSYGVLLWEIFSLGERPYSGLNTNEIMEFLKSGSRMQKPKRCPKNIFDDIMQPCWSANPQQRPTFAEIYTYMRTVKNPPAQKKWNFRQCAKAQKRRKLVAMGSIEKHFLCCKIFSHW